MINNEDMNMPNDAADESVHAAVDPTVDILHDCPSYTTHVTMKGLLPGDRVVLHRANEEPVTVLVEPHLHSDVSSPGRMPHGFWARRYRGHKTKAQMEETFAANASQP
jgi:hypothetical protein